MRFEDPAADFVPAVERVFGVRPPNAKATVGDVGVTSRSNRSNASACSRAITVRTFWACP